MKKYRDREIVFIVKTIQSNGANKKYLKGPTNTYDPFSLNVLITMKTIVS